MPSMWLEITCVLFVTHYFTFFHLFHAIITTREQTLERCPNLALASAFFAPGTKGSYPTVVRGAGTFSPGW